jgi:hypothetical protein
MRPGERGTTGLDADASSGMSEGTTPQRGRITLMMVP